MQIKNVKFFIPLSVSLASFFMLSCSAYRSETVFAQKNEIHSVPSNGNTVTSQPSSNNKLGILTEYEIIGKDCFKKSRCLTFIYVDEKFFNTSDILVLTNFLKKKNKNKSMLHLYFFDSLSKADAHSTGKFEPRDLNQNARGVFYYDRSGEYLKIKLNKDDSSEWKTVFRKTPGNE